MNPNPSITSTIMFIVSTVLCIFLIYYSVIRVREVELQNQVLIQVLDNQNKVIQLRAEPKHECGCDANCGDSELPSPTPAIQEN